MTHLEDQLHQLRQQLVELWELVIHQVKKTQEALTDFDKDLAREVVVNEKRVNALELKIDRDCENIFALFNPVAVDLRLVLAVLKINNNLERTGDIAEGIAKFIVSAKSPFDPHLLGATRVIIMYEEANAMLQDIMSAFINEDTKLARSIFKRDEVLDDINRDANRVIMDHVRDHPENLEHCLHILSTIRKLERVGDQSKNIAEEIIFYVEAKVLKHSGKM